MGSCNTSTNCNPCGPDYNAINQLASKAAVYARQAKTSATNAENAWLEFNALYLGAFAVAPTVDNEGDPLQEGALYFNTISNQMFVWQGGSWIDFDFDEFTPFLATGTTTARNLVTREADVINVKDFGAIGDGVTDDTSAFQTAISHLNTLGVGLLFVPTGNYLLSDRLTSIKPIAIRGTGMGKSVMQWTLGAASRGILIQSGTSTAVTDISELTLITFAAGLGTAIEVDYSGNINTSNNQIMPRTRTRLRINNVQMRGASGQLTSGWLHHIDGISILGALVTGCAVEGMGEFGNMTSQSAYRFRGAGLPVEIILNECNAYFVEDAVYSDLVEGLFVSLCNLVAVNRGVVFTSNAQEPQCHVTNSHINAYLKCIDLNQARHSNINNNLLYSRLENVTQAIGLDISNTCNTVIAIGNTFMRCGIKDGGSDNVFQNNIFELSNTAIEILASSTNSIEADSKFVNVTTPFSVTSSSFKRESLGNLYNGDLRDLANEAPGVTLTRIGASATQIPAGATANGSFVVTTVWNSAAAYQEFYDFGSSTKNINVKKNNIWSGWRRNVSLPAGGPTDTSGTGSPEGIVTASVGSTYRRTDGGAGTTFYVKESGTGSTGWVAK